MKSSLFLDYLCIEDIEELLNYSDEEIQGISFPEGKGGKMTTLITSLPKGSVTLGPG